MSSKAIAFLCLLALVMMIASEVTARELAEEKELERTRLEESQDGGGDGYVGGRGGYNCGYRTRCCRSRCCYNGSCHCCKPGEKPVESVPGSMN